MNIVSCILLRVSPRSHNRPPFITAASTLNTSSIKTHCLRTYVKIRYVLEYLEGNWIETLSLPTNGLMCDPPGSFIFRTIVTQKIELYCLHVECWAEGDKAPGGGGGSLSECFLLHGDFLSGSTPGWTLLRSTETLVYEFTIMYGSISRGHYLVMFSTQWKCVSVVGQQGEGKFLPELKTTFLV